MKPFEPAEKKFLFQTHPTSGDLRELPTSFWSTIVNACGGEILSTLKTTSCRAHVLSASSLFIWRNKALLITCGETKLMRGVNQLFYYLPIEAASYIHRKEINLSSPESSWEPGHLLVVNHPFKSIVFKGLTANAAVWNGDKLLQPIHSSCINAEEMDINGP